MIIDRPGPALRDEVHGTVEAPSCLDAVMLPSQRPHLRGGARRQGLRYKLDDGTEYKSASSAGKAVTGGACNGWVFWQVDGSEQPKRGPKAKAAKMPRAETKKAPGKKRGAKKGAAKRPKAARAASVASFGCGVCPETFKTMKAATAHTIAHTR